MKVSMLLILVLTPCCVFAAEDSVVYKQAKKANVQKCIGTIKELSDFVLKDSNHSAVSTWSNKNADGKLFNSVAVIKYADGNSYSIINAAPVTAGGCDSTYTNVYYNDKSCLATREVSFKDWKFKDEMNGALWLANDNSTVDVMLTPAGQGCLVLRTEVVFGK